jgi:putative SOS response-associated peptidase YedK
VGKLPPGFELSSDYDIAPSTFQPIIRAAPPTDERSMTFMRWGLVPDKVEDPEAFQIFTTTNARAGEHPRQAYLEDALQYLSLPGAARRIYEWSQRPNLSQPILFAKLERLIIREALTYAVHP